MFSSHVFVVFFVIISVVSCNSKNIAENLDDSHLITKTCLISDIQSFDITSKQILHYPDSIFVFSYKDFIIHHSYKLERFYNAIDKNDTSEIELVREVKLWDFFVFKKGATNGLYFDSIFGLPKNLQVDSFLNKRSPRLSLNVGYEKYYDLIRSKEVDGKLEKVFSAKGKNKGDSKDSLFLSFSRTFRDVNYSLSNHIDEKYGSNLYKMKMVLNKYYDDYEKVMIPRLETFIELRRIKITDNEIKTIVLLIKRLKSLK